MIMEFCANCLDTLPVTTNFNLKETTINSNKDQDDDYNHPELDHLNKNTQDDNTNSVKIMDRISSIYKLNYLTLFPHLGQDQEEGNEQNICEKCSNVFQILFISYEKFNKLRHIDSFISHQIEKLDKVIQNFQSECSSIPQFHDSTEVKEPFPLKVENEQDSDDDLDPSDFMETTQEEDSTPLQEDSTPLQDSLNELTSSQDTVQGPWVKLKRLTKAELSAAKTLKRKRKIKPRVKKIKQEKETNDEPTLTQKHIALWAEYLETSETGWSCKACKTFYTSPTAAKRHINSIHGDESFKCTEPNCTKSFESRSGLDAHMMHHKGERFKCDICQKVFSTPINLKTHKRIIHDGDKPFLCSFCGIKCGEARTLKTHLLCHGDERSFKCSQCPKSFKQQSVCKRHEATHSERAFLCPICGKVFLTDWGLRLHTRNMHPKGP